MSFQLRTRENYRDIKKRFQPYLSMETEPNAPEEPILQRCVVPGCPNPRKSQPSSPLMPFSDVASTQESWFNAMGLGLRRKNSGRLYCCEDHYDLNGDLTVLSVNVNVKGNAGGLKNYVDLQKVNPQWKSSEHHEPSAAWGRNELQASSVMSNVEGTGWHQPVSNDSDEQSLPRIDNTMSLRDSLHISQMKQSDGSPSSISDDIGEGELEVAMRNKISEFMKSDSCKIKSCGPEETPKIRIKNPEELIKQSSDECSNSSCLSSSSSRPRSRTVHRKSTLVSKNSAKHNKLSPVQNTAPATSESKSNTKSCIVPSCRNTNINSPDKEFLCVPLNTAKRRLWFTAVKKPFNHEFRRSVLYCCGDHFSERDLEVYSAHQTGGNIVRKRVRDGVLPRVSLPPKEEEISIGPKVHKINISEPSVTIRVSESRGETPSSVHIQRLHDSSVPPQIMIGKIAKENYTPLKSYSGSVNCMDESRMDDSTAQSRYLSETMPQYPTCNHDEDGPFMCKTLSALDISSFYTEFYDLPSSKAQNTFIFNLMERTSHNPIHGQVGFKFYIKKKTRDSVLKVPVCCTTFIGALSLEITWLVAMATRHFDKLDENSKGTDSQLSPHPSGQHLLNSHIGNTSGESTTRLVPVQELIAEKRNSQGPSAICRFEDLFDRVVFCITCISQFRSVKEYHDHKRKCVRKFPSSIQCRICSRIFVKIEHLKLHTLVVHKYVCIKCNRTFRFMRLLKPHLEECNGVRIVALPPAATQTHQEGGYLSLLQPYCQSQHRIDWNEFFGDASTRAPVPVPPPSLVEFELTPDKSQMTSIRGDVMVEATVNVTSSDLLVTRIPSSKDNRDNSRIFSYRSVESERSGSCMNNEEELVMKELPHEREGDSWHDRSIERVKRRSLNRKMKNFLLVPKRIKREVDETMDARGNDSDCYDSENEVQNGQGSLGNPEHYGDEFSFTCFKCGSEFSAVIDLKSHLRYSSTCGDIFAGTEQDKLATCFKCHSSFSSVNALKEHMKSSSCLPVPKDKARPVVCLGCKVNFSSELGLGLHLKRSEECRGKNPSAYLPGVVSKGLRASSYEKRKKDTDPAPTREESKVYMCVKCSATFSSVWGLRTHERNSPNCKPDKPYSFPMLVDRSEAERAKRLAIEKGLRAAPPEFNSDEKNSPQTVIVAPQKPFPSEVSHQCKICNAVFTSVWGLRTHERISSYCSPGKIKIEIMDPNTVPAPPVVEPAHGQAADLKKNERYLCQRCLAPFNSIGGLRTHERSSTLCGPEVPVIRVAPKSRSVDGISAPDFVYTCSRCDKSFSKLKLLRRHFKTSPECAPNETGEVDYGRYACPKCPQLLKTRTGIEQHFAGHSPSQSTYCCHICEKEFTAVDTMLKHIHWEHIGHWFCTFCFQDFTSFVLFYQHIVALHTEFQSVLVYECRICLRGFFKKTSLEEHSLLCKRSANNVYSCAICMKKFTRKLHISNHIKFAHYGLPSDIRYNYPCQNCPRVFLSESDLVLHSSNDCLKEDEELVCDHCSGVYLGKASLKAHYSICHSHLDPCLRDKSTLSISMKNEPDET